MYIINNCIKMAILKLNSVTILKKANAVQSFVKLTCAFKRNSHLAPLSTRALRVCLFIHMNKANVSCYVHIDKGKFRMNTSNFIPSTTKSPSESLEIHKGFWYSCTKWNRLAQISWCQKKISNFTQLSLSFT